MLVNYYYINTHNLKFFETLKCNRQTLVALVGC